MGAKINPREEIGMPYFIESMLEESQKTLYGRRRQVGIPETEEEITREAEDFYDEYFPDN